MRAGIRLSLTVGLALAAAGAPATTFAARRALVLGNGTYRHGGALINPKHDVDIVGLVLSQAGFAVTPHKHLTKQGMRAALREFARQVQPGDEVIFYYSGHGFALNHRNYLMGVDFRGADKIAARDEALAFEDVIEYLGENRPRVLVLMLDACRNDPWSRSWTRSARGAGFIEEPQRQGTYIAFATAPGATADDGRANDRGGPFAKAFAAAVRSGRGIDIDLAFRKVRALLRPRNQEPWTRHNLTGQFILYPAPPPPPPPPPSRLPSRRPASTLSEARPPPPPAAGRLGFGLSTLPEARPSPSGPPALTPLPSSASLAAVSKPLIDPPQWVKSRANGLWFTKTEITVAQYAACVAAKKCSTDNLHDDGNGFLKSSRCNWPERGARGQHPINCVDWYQATAYCRWVGARLATQAEWQSEATNRNRRKFPWGPQPPDCSRAVINDSKPVGHRDVGIWGCGADHTAEVCSRPKGNSVSGLCDLSGNVYEWVSDVGPRFKDNRVCMGGSWTSRATRTLSGGLPRRGGFSHLEPNQRHVFKAKSGADFIGIRCVKETGP